MATERTMMQYPPESEPGRESQGRMESGVEDKRFCTWNLDHADILSWRSPSSPGSVTLGIPVQGNNFVFFGGMCVRKRCQNLVLSWTLESSQGWIVDIWWSLLPDRCSWISRVACSVESGNGLIVDADLDWAKIRKAMFGERILDIPIERQLPWVCLQLGYPGVPKIPQISESFSPWKRLSFSPVTHLRPRFHRKTINRTYKSIIARGLTDVFHFGALEPRADFFGSEDVTFSAAWG